MRLLHTESLELKEFHGYIPPYAILSHTWDKEEVTFQDMQNLCAAQRKSGWNKIQGACAYARKHKFQWIWIDSCCINKESSAELSEAVNSMYQYYLDSHVCYVYLSDVGGDFEEDPRDINSTFRRSRWFTRGWTLQELLAPTYVVFLGRTWTEIGTKWSLRDAISAITSIPKRVLENGDIDSYSIAQRMSWAALRETTRAEDQAYCLMGIFGVNMSPIYGEGGANAFMRLQQEIIKISDDHSIFAWTALAGGSEHRGLLANSPREFAMSGEVRNSKSDLLGSFSFKNNGLHIHLPLSPVESHSKNTVFLASLNCCQSATDGNHFAVYLQKSTTNNRFVRCRASELPLTSLYGSMEKVVVGQNHLYRRYRRKSSSPHVEILAPTQDCIMMTDSSSAIEDDLYTQRQSITYKFCDAECEEHFSFQFKDHPLYGFKVKTKVEGLNAGEWTGHPDRIIVPLKNGGIVASAIHITPSSRELEVNYIPRENSSVSTLTKQLGASLTLGFLVLVCDLCHALNLEGVFPPDYFQTRYNDTMIYSVSIPDTKTIRSRSDKAFRLLVYSYNSFPRADIIFIALGFYAGKVWTDITVFPRSSKPDPEQIWNSYLDGGSRAKVRLRRQASSSYEIDGLDWRILMVTAKERDNLQRGSHSLQIDLRKRYSTLDM